MIESSRTMDTAMCPGFMLLSRMIHLIHVHLENVKLDIQIIHQLNTMLDGSWMLKSTDIEPPLLGKIVFAISRIDGINFDFSDVFK